MNNEEKRFQAATAALQGILAFGYWETHPVSVIASWSVELGDALIAELDRTKPETETPKPDADGWIPHRPGDPIPCDEGAMCYRKYRNGKTGIRGIAGDFSWGEWGGGEHEIIAWKPA